MSARSIKGSKYSHLFPNTRLRRRARRGNIACAQSPQAQEAPYLCDDSLDLILLKKLFRFEALLVALAGLSVISAAGAGLFFCGVAGNEVVGAGAVFAGTVSPGALEARAAEVTGAGSPDCCTGLTCDFSSFSTADFSATASLLEAASGPT